MDENKIYLKLNDDRTWSAVVAAEQPTKDHVFFTSEGEYPTEILYSRNDLNGSGVLSGDECPDRESLLQSLTWIGQCGYTVLNLWDYDIEYPWDAKIEAIFEAAHQRRYEQEQIAAAEYFEVSMDDCDPPSESPLSWSFHLDNNHLARVDRCADRTYDFAIWERAADGSKGNLCAGGSLSKVDSIKNLSDAVKWVFQNSSRVGLAKNAPLAKESLDDKIQCAESRVNESHQSKSTRFPQR